MVPPIFFLFYLSHGKNVRNTHIKGQFYTKFWKHVSMVNSLSLDFALMMYSAVTSTFFCMFVICKWKLQKAQRNCIVTLFLVTGHCIKGKVLRSFNNSQEKYFSCSPHNEPTLLLIRGRIGLSWLSTRWRCFRWCGGQRWQRYKISGNQMLFSLQYT